MAVSKLVDYKVQSQYHGGKFARNQPTIALVHSTETPTEEGRSYQSALYVSRVGLSAHYFIDPSAITNGLDETLVAWAAGTINPRAIHFEFAGYAKFTKKQWETKKGLQMISRGAKLMHEVLPRLGIPIRILTDAQFLAAYRGTGPGGIGTHDQASRLIGGTTHWDPGPNFPLHRLLKKEDFDMDKKEAEALFTSVIKKTVPALIKKELQNYEQPRNKQGEIIRTKGVLSGKIGTLYAGWVLHGDGENRVGNRDLLDSIEAEVEGL